MRFHRVLLIVNPVARTVSKPTLAVIEKALSADFRLEVSETKERGHANELAAQAVEEGIDLVVVFSRRRDDQRGRQCPRRDRDRARRHPGRRHEHPGARARPADRPGRGHGRPDHEGARRRGVPPEPRTCGRPVLRGQLRRGRRRRSDATPGRQVPEHEGEVRPRRVPRGRLGAVDRLRRALARPGGQHRRRGDHPVALGHGRTHRSVHLLQGPGPADDAGGLTRLGARRPVGAQARAAGASRASRGRSSARRAT